MSRRKYPGADYIVLGGIRGDRAVVAEDVVAEDRVYRPLTVSERVYDGDMFGLGIPQLVILAIVLGLARWISR